ncbi:hypothetical protein V501_02964 [Pseudogymnoascus sp. VKM F-4519 (FW-2642)]|nr:hypothetical protein V501_02964 [Pseudogymnoascus sp. VKM F-4519 (FW-2642)]
MTPSQILQSVTKTAQAPTPHTAPKHAPPATHHPLPPKHSSPTYPGQRWEGAAGSRDGDWDPLCSSTPPQFMWVAEVEKAGEGRVLWWCLGEQWMGFGVTRSHKLNDRDHAGLADGTASAEEHLPRYFAKAGHVDADPKKTKKNGGGRGNWGIDGEEIQDEGFNITNARRRSNSSSYAAGLKDFKTKFEQFEPDPVFEEDIHGARPEDDMEGASRVTTAESSESGGSVADEEGGKKGV